MKPSSSVSLQYMAWHRCQRFSKNLRVASKFYAIERRHEQSFILRAHKCWVLPYKCLLSWLPAAQDLCIPVLIFIYFNKVKVRCTLLQALRICTGLRAQRGSRVIALLFLDHGTRRGWGVSFTPRPLSPSPRKRNGTICTGGWVGPRVWTGAGNLSPHQDSISGPSSP